jgi:hypothetical protein
MIAVIITVDEQHIPLFALIFRLCQHIDDQA